MFTAFLALYPALMGWLSAKWLQRSGIVRFLLGLPALWLLTEWLRGLLLTGFPWLSIGYSQIDTWLAAYAPYAGSYATGLAVCVSAGALAALLTCKGNFNKLASLFSLFVLWLAAYLLQTDNFTRPVGEPVSVVMLQGNVSQHEKWLPGMRATILDRYRDMTIKELGADIIIWPETAVPDFYHRALDDYLADLSRLAEEQGTDLIIGVPMVDYRDDAPRFFNSVVRLGGKFAVYHKRHLVPFGEYVPFGNLLRKIGGVFDLPMSDFYSGEDSQTTLPAAGHKLGITICYEDIFGEETAASLPEASLLVNVSNDAWFGNSLAPHQHLEMARMRALETGRPLLRSTNTGISAIISKRGEITVSSPQFAIHSLRATVQPMQGETPYISYGDKPVVILAAVMLLLGGFCRYRTGETRDSALG
jgi:apolipoprotein N-acyltransferase